MPSFFTKLWPISSHVFFWESNGVLLILYIKDMFFLFLDLIGPEEKKQRLSQCVFL